MFLYLTNMLPKCMMAQKDGLPSARKPTGNSSSAPVQTVALEPSSTFNSACSTTCFSVICHLCVFLLKIPRCKVLFHVLLCLPCFMPSYQRIDVMFVSIYTISSCQSSSIPTYVGLSESLMVSFPDNLQHPCWRLYEIRQPPISLCTTSNFLI